MKSILVSAQAIALCAVLPVAAQEHNLSLAHWVPGTHPLQVRGMEPWAESLSEATDGRVQVTIYPSSQLGAAGDHYDLARDGIADIGFINPGYQPGRFPIIAAAELPFLFANSHAGARALTEWYKDYAEEEMSDVYFCMAILHDPGTFHGKEPIVEPADIAGKTVRPANATQGRFVNLLGGASVQVPAGEMRDALARGIADITQSPWESLFIFGANEFVTHHLDMPLYGSINAFVINPGTMEALSDEDRAAVEDHCTPEAAERMSAGWGEVEAAGREKLDADPRHTLHRPTDEQVQLWRDAAAPLTDEWRQTISAAGRDPDAILDGLVEALQRYDSYAN